MTTYDSWKATDDAANDADRRAEVPDRPVRGYVPPQVSPECEGGNHAGCDEAACDFPCACSCHDAEEGR